MCICLTLRGALYVLDANTVQVLTSPALSSTFAPVWDEVWQPTDGSVYRRNPETRLLCLLSRDGPGETRG
ncbi:hypothetical protein RRG08_027700 [Elysia crispata]|uniref:Uncharacterized protein n=1 Tax=Elysia crispata TaxID=231223 RepID=A0AAE0XM38_9GAST|nr:hypothetical protein RRG08_027700 [Elysia crispata]